MPLSRLLYTSRSCLVPAELTVEQQVSNMAARAAILLTCCSTVSSAGTRQERLVYRSLLRGMVVSRA